MIVTIGVVTNNSTIAQAKGLTSLLADLHTSSDLGRAITLGELIGIGISLDGSAEGLSRTHGQVLDVVSVQISSLSASRTLGNTSQTVPSITFGILIGLIQMIQDATVYTGLIQTLASLVPSNFESHN